MRWFLRLLRRGYRRLIPRFVKRAIPTSLFGRSVLIILLPIVLMQGAVAYAFFDAEWRTVTTQLSEALASDVAFNVALYRTDPAPTTLAKIAKRAERTQSITVSLQPDRTLPSASNSSLLPPLDQALRSALDDKLEEPVWVDTTRYPDLVDMRVQVKGGVLRFLAPRDRAFASRGPVFLVWLTVATLALAFVAIVFIRNQVRAIERLASAAEAFGRGVDVRFKPYGAREVRQAGRAFLDMKDRIQRHIEQRTLLLASVSHDLRTPLTRLKLETALSEPSPRLDQIKRDLREMEHMIDEYLAFARGEGGEDMEEIDLASLVREIVASDSRGKPIAVKGDDALTVSVRRVGMKRAISNLIGNALSHGSLVTIDLHRRDDGAAELWVDDDGPGIRPELYEEAFRPFSRLDASRNQNEKGVGLGMAIARDVVRSHGGEVSLDRSPLGGLRATVTLPGSCGTQE